MSELPDVDSAVAPSPQPAEGRAPTERSASKAQWLARVVRDPRLLTRLLLGLELAVALAIAIGFALNLGLNYGVNNQVDYLIPSLRVLDGDLFKKDWFTAETTHIHPGYKYVGALLIALDPGGWGIGVGLVVVVAAGTFALYWLLRGTIGPKLALAGFALTVTVMFMTQTRGPAVSYIYDYILQPSTLGSAAFFGAAAFFVSQRFLASGLMLATSGLFHANYLILFSAAFGVAHLLLGWRGLFRRLLVQLGPPTLVLLLLLPMLFAAAGSGPDALRARQILIEIRGPHHFVIRNQYPDFVPFLAWNLIGIGSVTGLSRGAAGTGQRRLLMLLVGLLTVIWFGVVASVAFESILATSLFPWRITPHAELLLQVLAVGAALRLVSDPAQARRFGVGAIALVVTGIGMLSYAGVARKQAELPNLVLMAVLLVAAVSLTNALPRLPSMAKVRLVALKYVPVLLTLVALVVLWDVSEKHLRAVEARSNLMRGLFSRPDMEFFAWMNGTPKDSVFLTPPALETMRFHGRRAIVVDWKSSPVAPHEILEWYRRLQDVTGRPAIRGFDDLRGYETLDVARLEMLRTRYDLDYAVLRRGRDRPFAAYPRAFENGIFVVLDLTKR